MYPDDQIAVLHAVFNATKTIDPGSEAYARLCAWLDKQTTPALRQLNDAKINFVSELSLNRLIRRGAFDQKGL